jgi:hypothetical protein
MICQLGVGRIAGLGPPATAAETAPQQRLVGSPWLLPRRPRCRHKLLRVRHMLLCVPFAFTGLLPSRQHTLPASVPLQAGALLPGQLCGRLSRLLSQRPTRLHAVEPAGPSQQPRSDLQSRAAPASEATTVARSPHPLASAPPSTNSNAGTSAVLVPPPSAAAYAGYGRGGGAGVSATERAWGFVTTAVAAAAVLAYGAALVSQRRGDAAEGAQPGPQPASLRMSRTSLPTGVPQRLGAPLPSPPLTRPPSAQPGTAPAPPAAASTPTSPFSSSSAALSPSAAAVIAMAAAPKVGWVAREPGWHAALPRLHYVTFGSRYGLLPALRPEAFAALAAEGADVSRVDPPSRPARDGACGAVRLEGALLHAVARLCTRRACQSHLGGCDRARQPPDEDDSLP